MNEEKIKPNMSAQEIVITMCEGNPGAINVLMQMIGDPNPRGFLDILLLDSMGIRGSQIYMLWSDCSDKNMEKYFRTLMMLRCGIFSTEQVKGNLGLVCALPFIDDSISSGEIPNYGEDFGPTHPLWDTFCQTQKEAFVSKFEAKIEQEGITRKGSN